MAEVEEPLDSLPTTMDLGFRDARNTFDMAVIIKRDLGILSLKIWEKK